MAKKNKPKIDPQFDPYWEWLKIPPEQQPPHHYRLLGLKPFETESALIESSVTRLVERFHRLSQGAHVEAAQQILNQVAQARLCLNDPQKKQVYDSRLRARLVNPNGQKSSEGNDNGTAPPVPKAPSSPSPKTQPVAPKKSSGAPYKLPAASRESFDEQTAKQVRLMKIATAAMLVLGGVVGALFVWFAFGGQPTKSLRQSLAERSETQSAGRPADQVAAEPAAPGQDANPGSVQISPQAASTAKTGGSSESDDVIKNSDSFAEAAKQAAKHLSEEKANQPPTSTTNPPTDNSISSTTTNPPATSPNSDPATVPSSSTATVPGLQAVEGFPGTYLPAKADAFLPFLKEVIGVQGEVKSVRTSVSGKTVYLMFAPVKNDLIEIRSRSSAISLEDLGGFIGKQVRVRGVLKTEFGSNTPGIEIEAISQIELIQP